MVDPPMKQTLLEVHNKKKIKLLKVELFTFGIFMSIKIFTGFDLKLIKQHDTLRQCHGVMS
jgi:hypothetical protein